MSDFTVPACANCGHAIWPPRLACPVCGAAEWENVPAQTGTLLDVTEAQGYDGEPIRLGTVRVGVPDGDGPPAIAGVDPDAQPDDTVRMRLIDGALRAEK